MTGAPWRRYWCVVEGRYPSGMYRLVCDGLLDPERGRVFLVREGVLPATAGRGDRYAIETRECRGLHELRAAAC